MERSQVLSFSGIAGLVALLLLNPPQGLNRLHLGSRLMRLHKHQVVTPFLGMSQAKVENASGFKLEQATMTWPILHFKTSLPDSHGLTYCVYVSGGQVSTINAFPAHGYFSLNQAEAIAALFSRKPVGGLILQDSFEQGTGGTNNRTSIRYFSSGQCMSMSYNCKTKMVFSFFISQLNGQTDSGS